MAQSDSDVCKEQLDTLMSESSTAAEQGSDKPTANAEGKYSSRHARTTVKSLFHLGSTVCNRRLICFGSFLL